MVAMPPDAVSLADLARERGVSGQAIRKRVSKLEDDGVLISFRSPTGAKYVSRAAYDFAVGVTGDPVKEASAASAAVLRGAVAEPIARPAPARMPTPTGEGVGETDTPAYRDAKARDAYYAAELKRLSFEKENGQLYRVTEIEASMVRISDAVRDAAKGIVSRAEEGAEALESGMPAFRRWLVQIGDDMCRALASKLRIIAAEAEAPETPEPDGEEEE